MDVEKYARVVPLAEIEQNDWNLNISRYVDTSEEEERIDVAEAVRKLRELERERAAAEETMNRYLAELGYDVQESPRRSTQRSEVLQEQQGC